MSNTKQIHPDQTIKQLNEELQKKAEAIYLHDDANQYGFNLYKLIHDFDKKLKAVLDDERN